MGKYQGYEKYKNSDIEWLGEIPEHWKVSRAKLVSEIFVPQRNKPELNLYDGLPWLTMDDMLGDRVSHTKFKVTKEASIKAGSKSLKKGSVIASCIGNFGVCTINNVDVIINQQLQAFIPNSHVIPEYLRELVKISSDYFQMIATAATVVYVNQAGFANMPITLPPPDEQEAIARFLDHKTKQIDNLIAKKETLIEKLNEKRTALISHAVTKGIDTNVPMRDSGVEWLGEIPKHWKPVKLKYICSLLRDGTHLPPPRVDNGIPLLSVRNIINNCFVNLEDDSLISEKDFQELNKSFQVLENDILLAIVGATLGKVAIVQKMPIFTIQRSLAVLRSKAGVCVHKFLFYFIKSPDFQKLLWLNTGFSAQPGIYLGSLANFFVPIPPIAEQAKIITYLDQKITQIEQQKAKIQEAIELLKEYRTALITNAVTGKIDVRQVPIP